MDAVVLEGLRLSYVSRNRNRKLCFPEASKHLGTRIYDGALSRHSANFLEVDSVLLSRYSRSFASPGRIFVALRLLLP